MRKNMMLLLMVAACSFVVSAPAVAAEQTPVKEYKKHKVAGGESLSIIAEANQLPSWKTIWDVNEHIANPDLINPGEELNIPAVGQQTPDRPLPAAQAVAPVSQQKLVAASRSAAPKAAPVYGGTTDGAWAALRACESGGNYAANTGNGYYGAYQYNSGTWNNYGGYARADLAPPAVQDAKAQDTQSRRGWSPWPACSRKLGLR